MSESSEQFDRAFPDPLSRFWHLRREDFLQAVAANPSHEDAFARTFVAKCDMIDAWDELRGILIDGRLAGAIVTTVTKRKPHVANLQLLHTFSWARRRGVAAALCRYAVASKHQGGIAGHFRVSSEPESVEFYRRIGFRFWGEQKSGTLLSIFRMDGHRIENGVYDPSDPVILRAIGDGTRKGNVVKRFEEPR